MQITVDIGNTRTKIGLFEGKTLVEKVVWADWTALDLVSYGQQAGAEQLIFSSVAEPDTDLTKILSAHFKTVELTHQTPLPFYNLYQTPLTLGKDRLAAVAGAQALFGECSCVIIDCGTCIKYEALTARREYLGGNIAPGAVMRLKSMRHFTARLPEAPMEMPDQVIGYSTETALQNGALLGAVIEMIGFIQLFDSQINSFQNPNGASLQRQPLQVILTGGDALFFLPFLQKQLQRTLTHEHYAITHQPDVTLYGLNHILTHSFLNTLNI